MAFVADQTPISSTLPGRAGWLPFGAALLVVAWLFWWADTPRSRYQEYPAHFEMIFQQPQPADVLIFGSSLSMTAFDAARIERLCEQKTGRRATVYNMSATWEGTGLKYVMLRDYLARKTPKAVFVEYYPVGDYIHDHFYMVAPYADIFESSFAKKNKPAWYRLQESVTLSLKKLVHQLNRLVLGKRIDLDDTLAKPGPVSDKTVANPLRPEAVVRGVRSGKPLWDSGRQHQWDVFSPVESRNRFYFHKIADMLRAGGVTLGLYNLPGVFQPEFSEAFLETSRNEYGVGLSTLSRQELAALYPDAYADNTHLNQRGRLFWSEWMAARIAATLGAQ